MVTNDRSTAGAAGVVISSGAVVQPASATVAHALAPTRNCLRQSEVEIDAVKGLLNTRKTICSRRALPPPEDGLSHTIRSPVMRTQIVAAVLSHYWGGGTKTRPGAAASAGSGPLAGTPVIIRWFAQFASTKVDGWSWQGVACEASVR